MASTILGPGSAEPEPLPEPKVSQIRILLAAVERDPSLYNDAVSDMISVRNIEKWLNLSDKLNECLDGAKLSAQEWKCMLRYWADSVMEVDVMSKEHLAYNKANPTMTLKEAKELTRLERRFYNFVKKEEVKYIIDVTYMGKFGADQAKKDMDGASDSVNVKVPLMNVFPVTVGNDENVCSNGPKERTIHVMEEDPTYPSDPKKKLEIMFDENLALDYEEAENKQILAMTLERLQMVARVLEEHVESVQHRIDVIKDMKKHLYEDNDDDN